MGCMDSTFNQKQIVIDDKKEDDVTFNHLYAINAMIEQSQDTELALLDDQLTASFTQTMLSEFNSTLKQFDDFDWDDLNEHNHKKEKYKPLNIDFTKRKKQQKQQNVNEMCQNIIVDIIRQMDIKQDNVHQDVSQKNEQRISEQIEQEQEKDDITQSEHQ